MDQNYPGQGDDLFTRPEFEVPPPPPPPPQPSSSTRQAEDQLVVGLAVMLDYLNHGNGEPHLSRLRHRAESWCHAYFGKSSAFVFHNRSRQSIGISISMGSAGNSEAVPAGPVPVPGLPQPVRDVHPHLFDTNRLSYMRLESDDTPSLIHDESDAADDDDDAMSVDGGLRRRSSVKPCPVYAEMVLLPDAVIRRVVRRCDRHRAALEAALRSGGGYPLVQQRHESYSSSSSAGPSTPAYGAGLYKDQICIRACDLLGSPIILYLPELLAQLAQLPPPVVLSAFDQFLSRKQQLVTDHEALQQAMRDLAGDSSSPSPLTPPPPPPGLRSPFQVSRASSFKRQREDDNDHQEEAPAKGKRRKSRWSFRRFLK